MTYAGRVTEVARAVDSDTRTLLVTIALPSSPGGLTPGMFGRAAFAGSTRRLLTVPDGALVRSGQLTSVFVVDGERARLRFVNVGRSADGATEIRAGLSEGESVVVDPPPSLRDGTPVTPPTTRNALACGGRIMTTGTGAAGRLAAAFIRSPLTPLFIGGAIALGALAVLALPREEEPQIVVPMIDVFVEMPGASSAEVEQRVTRPLEQLLWEIPGVEYLYSTSSPGSTMVVVRFYVGENEANALVRLNQKLASNADRMPPGVVGPLVKARSIDDVPVMAVTLWGERYDDHTLRLFAAELAGRIKEVPDVSEVTLIGGRPRQMSVELDPQRLAAYDVDPAARAAGHPVRERAHAWR